jgi:hypothetical protein
MLNQYCAPLGLEEADYYFVTNIKPLWSISDLMQLHQRCLILVTNINKHFG